MRYYWRSPVFYTRKSPVVWNAAFEELNIKSVFQAFDVDEVNLEKRH